jgi:methylmalonyl-CoA/ethylmalonyl-CoA epimerase
LFILITQSYTKGSARFVDGSLSNYIIFIPCLPAIFHTYHNYSMQKIEHIGIAVKSLSASVPLFEKLLNSSCYKIEKVDSEKVNTAFFKTGETKVELLESQEADGVISKFIEKKGEGIHHIAFEVNDLASEIDRLKKEGFTILDETPKKGADNKLICFVHPKSSNEVLIELCQSI